MDKEAIKGFLRWLEEASDAELDARREDIQQAWRRVSSREGKADINLALRLLDEEVLSRLSLKKHA